jgi:2,4-dienoyl-CoA reductase-like NADH-dependent reductase (Old Yellow Enzyme family)
MSGPATLSPSKIRPGYQVPYAEAVRRETGLATMAVGAIIAASQANDIVASGKADLVAIGRELMADPGFVYRAAVALRFDGASALLPDHYGFYIDRRAKVLERD